MASYTERLIELRKLHGITQKELAEKLHTSDRNYRRYEAGTSDPATTFTIALANYFNVSIDYLVGRTDNPEVNK